MAELRVHFHVRLDACGVAQVQRREGVGVFDIGEDADTFAALYLSDAAGIKPYVEMYTQFRQVKDGLHGIVTSSADLLELDPSPAWVWLHLAGKDAEIVFQLHRSKVMQYGKANKSARSEEDFNAVYLEVARANYGAWLERGVLVRM